MKVGIFTFPNSTSYGATLQMYALYKKVKDLGHDAEIINYHNAYMKAEKHCRRKIGRFDLRRSLRYFAKKLLHRRLEKGFRDFEKNNMALYPSRPVVDKRHLPELGKRYGAVICGSDQVWNPNITDSDMSYFLDFCGEETKRISYAPSFGISEFTQEFSDLIRPHLAAIDSLSVREEAGREYIKREFGRDSALVCDPTMLLDTEEWNAVEREYPIGEDSYILFYTIRSSEKLMQYCRKLSEKTGLKIIVVGGNVLQKIKNNNKNIEYAVDISPSEWLWLVHNARYVVTNSFHGTAFSIIFHKDFYLELSSATNSRLENITTKLGLESRIIKDEIADPTEPCDYSISERNLPLIVEDSVKFITEALCAGENHG